MEGSRADGCAHCVLAYIPLATTETVFPKQPGDQSQQTLAIKTNKHLPVLVFMAFIADTDTAELPDCPLLSENMAPRHHCSSWLSLLSSSFFVFPLGVDLFSYFFFEIISTFADAPSMVSLLNSPSFLILLSSFYSN